jgi:integrase
VIHYTGLTTGSSLWLKESQRFSEGDIQCADKNRYLDKLEEVSRTIYQSLAYKDGIPQPADFRKQLKIINLNPGHDFLLRYIDFMEKNMGRWSDSSYRKCRSLLTHLEQFKLSNSSRISIAAVDDAFVAAFAGYLTAKGLSVQSVRGYVGVLKWFLNDAYRKGLILSNSYRNFRTQPVAKTVEHVPVFLTMKEIASIQQLGQLPGKLERSRDIFRLMAFSGIRIDEIKKLKKSDVDEKEIRVSGRRERKIPHNPYTREIFEKYRNKYFRNDRFIQVYSVPTLTSNLRELARRADLTRTVTFRRKGQPWEGSIADLVTIQSAQVSFQSNFLKMGINPSIILEWQGRKSFRSVYDPILYNKTQQAGEIQKISTHYAKVSP